MNATMIDSVQILNPANVAHDYDYVAIYVNGRFSVDPATVQKAYPDARVFWIDVLGNNPEASIKDIETGDISPSSVPGIVAARFRVHPDANTRLYCNLSTWPAVKTEVRNLPQNQRDTIRYWIANPTGTPHIVPGSDATQYMFGQILDLSEVNTDTF